MTTEREFKRCLGIRAPVLGKITLKIDIDVDRPQNCRHEETQLTVDKVALILVPL